MLNSFFKCGCVLSSALLVGCLSSPATQHLPPQQAMTQAYAQLYKVPNYEFSGQLKFDSIDVTPLSQSSHKTTGQHLDDQLSPESAAQLSDAEAGDELVDAKSKQTSLAQKLGGDKKFDGLIQRMIKTYGERYRFNYRGVIDLRHQHLELIPEFRYEARNMGGYVSVPMLLDLSNAKLYADLAALSPWLVSPDSEGKYTRVDLKDYQDKIDHKKLFEMLRDTTLASYQLGQAGYFKEVALSSEERQLGASRKVQFDTPLSQYVANLVTFAAMNKAYVQQEVFKQSGLKQPDQDNAAAAIDVVTDAAPAVRMDVASVKAAIQQDPSAYQAVLKKVEESINPASTFVQQAVLDSKGRVIQSNWHIELMTKDAKKYQVKLKLGNQLKFFNYGRASVAYQPKEGNWIDLKSSMDNSLFGTLFSQGFLGLSEAAMNKKLDNNLHDNVANNVDEQQAPERAGTEKTKQ